MFIKCQENAFSRKRKNVVLQNRVCANTLYRQNLIGKN